MESFEAAGRFGASVRKARVLIPIFALVGLGTISCTSEDRHMSSWAAVDSAGIEVVENNTLAYDTAERWAVQANPDLEIQSPAAGDFTLFQVADVGALPDGRIAVLNGLPLEVLVFGHDGTLQDRFGGQGEGPGEFRSPGSLLLWADTIAVWDPGARRLSVFSEDGRLGRDLSLAGLWQGSLASTASRVSDEVFFLFTTIGFPLEPKQGVTRASSESYLLSPEGEVLARLGPFPGNEVFVGGVGMGLALFGARSFSASSSHGVVTGNGEDSEVRLFRPDGTLWRIIRWPDGDRTIPRERIDRFFEVALAATPEAQRAAAQAMVNEIPVADRVPSHSELFYLESGEVWVGEYPGPEEIIPTVRPRARKWIVFDDRGALVSTVETPEGFTPHAVAEDRIFGVFEDDLGIESIRVLRIIR